MSAAVIQLSTLFTSDAIASSFDAQCTIQAAQGRTFPPLLTMLDGAYGLQVPASTAMAIKYLNANLFQQPKLPKLAQGIGSRAAGVVVTQALHAYAQSLRAGMADPAKAPEVAALPAWADPVAIAAAKVKRKEAKVAAKVDAEAVASATPDTDTDTDTIDIGTPKDIAAEAMSQWAKFEAYLSFGAITVAQRDAMIDALSKAVTRAEPAPKKAKRAKSDTAKVADVVADAVAQTAQPALI